MKIKRGATPKPVVPPDAPNAGNVPAGDPPATRYVSKSASRILVPVTSSGIIDLAKMNRDARKQLQDLLKNEGVQKQLGFGPPAATFDPETMKYLYDGVGRAYQTIGKYLLKYPEAACQELLYTEAEKTDLGPATANMLDAYAPEFLARHQALFAWGVMFAGITQQKFARAGEVADAEKKKPHFDRAAPATDVFPTAPETKQ
jgi:hypothetical protein